MCYHPDNINNIAREGNVRDKNNSSIQKHFSNITDPRRYNKRHVLLDIITISICSVICSADTYEQIEEFGKAKYEWFNQFLELPHGIPSADTFERVFALINPTEFRDSFLNWVKAISELTKGQVIAIDGKTLRRSHDKSIGKKAIHMVSAWAAANGIVIGQKKTEEKSNEITAIPELLKLIEVEGCIVTIDAMGCQRNIAKTICDEKADYVLALKGNQSRLHDNVELFFQEQFQNDFKDTSFDYHETTDNDHGKMEIRRYWITSEIEWLQGKESWKNIKTIGMVQRERHFENTKSKETSYYINSIEDNAKLFANAVRSHWSIENNLHWVLDIAFREDESRI